MNRFIRKAGVLLLLTVSGMVFSDEQGYRIAGIIASSTTTDWRAIIELPDGEQKLVSEGDFLGSEEKRVEIVKISKEGVILQFPGGERQMRLSQGERQMQLPQDKVIPLPSAAVSGLSREAAITASGTGVNVSDFSRLLDKQLSPDQLASVRGLEILNNLSESARLISYSDISDPEGSYTPIKSLNSGVDQLQKAIIEGKGLRITVEGDSNYLDIYIMPGQEE